MVSTPSHPVFPGIIWMWASSLVEEVSPDLRQSILPFWAVKGVKALGPIKREAHLLRWAIHDAPTWAITLMGSLIRVKDWYWACFLHASWVSFNLGTRVSSYRRVTKFSLRVDLWGETFWNSGELEEGLSSLIYLPSCVEDGDGKFA